MYASRQNPQTKAGFPDGADNLTKIPPLRPKCQENKATPYSVEIKGVQNFGERQAHLRDCSRPPVHWSDIVSGFSTAVSFLKCAEH
jgi:hypothetical protein